MKFDFIKNNSKSLILFFNGWGCDENLYRYYDNHGEDILIISNYSDLDIEFDFSEYQNIDLIAYSAGVFVCNLLKDKLPKLRKKIAINGNPLIFDKEFGIKRVSLDKFKDISLENYLEFRKTYLVNSDEELKLFNKYQPLRTIEDCLYELSQLEKYYSTFDKTDFIEFDKVLISENDKIFSPEKQKEFFKNNYQIVKNAGHHLFFKFNSFDEILQTAGLNDE